MHVRQPGRICVNLQKNYNLESPVFVANINAQKIYELTGREKQFHEIPKYPHVERDLAVILDKSIEVEKLLQTIEKSGGEFLKNAYVFDTYSGKQIESDKKSVAFRLKFQSPVKTLVEDEINKSVDKILQSLINQFSVQLRS